MFISGTPPLSHIPSVFADPFHFRSRPTDRPAFSVRATIPKLVVCPVRLSDVFRAYGGHFVESLLNMTRFESDVV